ncbi:MAG: hypothetical protein RL456_888 [Pseudomonadota bacterium]|jgi:peptide/nickel transport system ATP-binding protein
MSATHPAGATPALVEVDDLAVAYDVSPSWLRRRIEGRPRQWLHAVDGVTLSIPAGRTLALVGESGCGKSTVARVLAGLQPPSRGRVRFDGRDAGAPVRGERDRAFGRRIQLIVQDPHASLDPRWRVHDLIAEPLREHGLAGDAAQERAKVEALLHEVGLSPADRDRHPHQFSGGQRQRLCIARALATRPEFLICDEPTSALDVSVQAQVLNLMKDLQRDHGLTGLFISHNLAVVRHVADRVGVMYLGRLVEDADRAALFERPAHPYARMLLDAVPRLRAARDGARAAVRGEMPDPMAPPAGCAFHPRCPHADARCRAERPVLLPTGRGTDRVACHAVQEGRLG